MKWTLLPSYLLKRLFGRTTLIGTQCRWCDELILQTPRRSPIPLCNECVAFALSNNEAGYDMYMVQFPVESQLWIDEVKRKAGGGPEELVADACREDEREIVALQLAMGKAVQEGHPEEAKRFAEAFKEKLATHAGLEKLHQEIVGTTLTPLSQQEMAAIEPADMRTLGGKR